MSKKCFFLLYFLFAFTFCFSQDTAVDETLQELKNTVLNGKDTEKRKAAENLARIQEQLGLYVDACQYYSTAASLSGLQTTEGQNLLLGAVRCSLSVGDVSRADFLLSTALSAVDSDFLRSYVNLYAVWSWIIKCETSQEREGPIAVLESYVQLDSMLNVRPTLLLTLTHLTGDEKWKTQLKNDFPNSPETAIVQGSASLYPSPFWYFKNGN